MEIHIQMFKAANAIGLWASGISSTLHIPRSRYQFIQFTQFTNLHILLFQPEGYFPP